MSRPRTSLVCLALLLAAGLLRGSASLPADRGAAGAWQKLLALRTTASVLHTTAHPDDEQGGVLAWLSRGQGARVSMLTLNRGEAGDNAIGPELFDALGMIRTEELLLADRYYGVDEQYFTTVADYGFSKRLDEALQKWGHQHALGEVVRVIRIDRPLVVLSRWQGNARDGHGNHQAAGLLSQEAFQAAGDPAAFPEQVAEGLRPWLPLKLYMGGVREDEDWTVRVDAGAYSPWLGDSYANFGRIGLSFQRSQNSGRLNRSAGPAYFFYRRVASRVTAPEREAGFFDGIDTRLSGMFSLLGRPAPAHALEAMQAIEREVESAVQAFTLADPSACVPALVRGLAATRQALSLVAGEPDAVLLLQRKERQFAEAIHAAVGLDLTALAQAPGTAEPGGPFAAVAPPPTLGPVVPGQTFEVVVRLANRGGVEIAPASLTLATDPGWSVQAADAALPPLGANGVLTRRFTVTFAQDAPLGSRPYFHRSSITQDRYELRDQSRRHRPWAPPAAVAVARYRVNGVPVEARETVRRREARPPYGHETRELMVVPALAVSLTPAMAVVPAGGAARTLPVQVEVANNLAGEVTGEVTLELPAGWTSRPARRPFRFSRAGERRQERFEVSLPSVTNRTYPITAVATAGGRSYREGYEALEHRDLETRYLYRAARAEVRGLEVRTVPGLRVGYVMGVGDQVPAGVAQLGATVELLEEKELATGDLQRFDAIVTGTRAYGVREDLRTHNQRLLDYVAAGGNLVVLYNTPAEFAPEALAPHAAELPRDAEEVSEEDSPVEILAPDHPVLAWPNRITAADFEGWVEQRGSKFFRTWAPAYTAIVATQDQGQAPQKGGWLIARHGQGHYTYFAYALHRQLPYGVPGAYRLLANLLALGKPQDSQAATARSVKKP